MFCWPCTSIYNIQIKPTWCTVYPQYISSVDLYMFRAFQTNQDDSQLKRTVVPIVVYIRCTSWWWAINTPETYIYIYIHTQTHTDCSTRRVKHKWQTLRPGRDKHCLARQTCLMQQISLHERLQSSEVQHDAKETAIRRVSWLLRRLASNHNKAGGRDVNDSHVPPGCIPLLDKIIVLRWSRRPR